MATDRANIIIADAGSRLLASKWCIYIWTWPILKVKDKVMQIETYEYLINGDR